MSVGVILDRPKYEVNVGSVLRSAEIFGAREIVIIGTRYVRGSHGRWRAPTDVHNSAKRLNLREVDTMAEALALFPDHFIVVVERKMGGALLPAFRHPLDAVYVFGPEDGAVDEASVLLSGAEPAHVEIPAHLSVCNEHIGSLNLAQAVTVTLYDRISKTGAYLCAKGGQ